MDSKTLALITVFALSLSMMGQNTSDEQFQQFAQSHGKSYSSLEEETFRKAVFLTNLQEIDAHNSDETQTYKKGINKFTDLTQEEFKSIYLGRRKSDKLVLPEEEESVTVSDEVNWVTKGAVQKVKDQGQCGSCYAFGAAASAEGAKFISTGTLGDFSEQQIVSCDSGNYGCGGGEETVAFKHWKNNGICTETSYPYTSGTGNVASCKESSCTKDSFTISSWKSGTTESGLKSAAQVQPISIGVDANNWSAYSSGIFNNCNKDIDHAVLLAGYTSSYWLVKNSWGASWGESGYIRLAPGNTCGVTSDWSHVVV